MAFFGTVPNDCIAQFLRVIPFDAWQHVYVGCSGTFKIEAAIRKRYPDVTLHGNDVSLFSCPVGWFLTDDPQPIGFHDRLDFVNAHIADKPYEYTVAAVLLSQELARYSRNNAFCRKHWDYFVHTFAEQLEKGVEKLRKLRTEIRLDSYFAGDWRDHIEAAHRAGGGIAAFPPFFMGDYDSQFKFINANITWPEPSFRNYNPKELGSILDHCDDLGVNYMILSDQLFENRKPMLEYVQKRKVPHYCYSNHKRSSVRHLFGTPQPFLYTPVDPAKLTIDSQLAVTQADFRHINFLKDIYLAKSIIHTDGSAHYLVWLDNMLVGAVIYEFYGKVVNYTMPDGNTFTAQDVLYLLSDVVVNNANKLSKLVAMIATSRTLIAPIDHRRLRKTQLITTTARSKNPISMKYRGIYQQMSRRVSDNPLDEGGFIMQYGAYVTDNTPQDIYRHWFQRHSGLVAGEPRNNGRSRRSR